MSAAKSVTWRKIVIVVLIAAAAACLPRIQAHAYEEYYNTSYKQLTYNQKMIYASLTSMYKSKKKVEKRNFYCSSYDFYTARNALQNDNFRYSSGMVAEYKRYVLKSSGVTSHIAVTMHPEKTRARMRRSTQNEKKVKTIVKSTLKGKKTTRDKVIAINKYICKKLTYRSNAGTFDAALRTSYSKCTGYSSLFQAMCEVAGIQCCQVIGRAKGKHTWNQVKVGSAWYYVDPTWNDTTNNKYLLRKNLWKDHTSIEARAHFVNLAQCN